MSKSCETKYNLEEEKSFKELARFVLRERIKNPDVLLDEIWIKYKSTQKSTKYGTNI